VLALWKQFSHNHISAKDFPMGYRYRPLLEVFREALSTLQNEPGPMIPAKAELMEYLRQRIAQHEGLNRSTAA